MAQVINTNTMSLNAQRNLSTSGSSGGQQVPMWQGAKAILEGANCKGATGPVQPASCGVPAGATP